MRKFYVSFAVMFLFAANSIFAVADSIYYNFYVKHSDNTYCVHTPPVASFLVNVNNQESFLLADNAARWDASGSPNMDGSGRMGIELGYFQDKIKVGDSVFIKVVCAQSGEEGILKRKITSIPWVTPPSTLTLQKKTLPQTPQNIKVIIDASNGNRRVVTWDYTAGNTYSVYKRTLNEKLPNGVTNYLYTLAGFGISSGEYIDADVNAGENYIYIVLAKDVNGAFSPRSDEIRDDIIPINGLTAEAKSTIVKLSWNAPLNTASPVRGYNIYRREEGTSFTLIAYTGKDTVFVDSRLTSAKKYYYKVKARYDFTTEIAESGETSVTTLSASGSLYNYLTLRIAVVIYKKTNRGSIYDSEIKNMKEALGLGRLFYWRNSGMKLNVIFDYIVVNEMTTFTDPNAFGENMNITVNDLKARGVINTQYDIVFRICTATDGYYSYGAPVLGLEGPSRATGFSWIQWPINTGVIYPGKSENIPYGLTWVFTHEVQHAIDAILDNYVNAEDDIMYHGDTPWLFPVACGEQFDFQSKLFRNYSSYEYVQSDWGEIYQSTDNDKDGFPDNDPLVPLDEVRFGSSAESKDSDGDNLSDKNEAMSGAFDGSSPIASDTDGDGIEDGADKYPRYSCLNEIPKFKPVIDGIIDQSWPLFSSKPIFSKASGFSPKLYISYDADSLYIGLITSIYAQPQFNFEFEGDGFWHGKGNTFVDLDLTNLKIASSNSRLTTDEVRAIADAGLWDNETKYIQNFGDKKVFPVSALHAKGTKNGNAYQFEFSIPKNEDAGLRLIEGDSIAVNLYYNNLGSTSYATQFDQYEFPYFKLGKTIGVKDERAEIPAQYNLGQNYPNPFNPVTKITYALPQGGYVKLNLYDSLGRLVKTLVEGERSAGYYETALNASDLSSGIYFYELAVKNFRSVKKMCVLK